MTDEHLAIIIFVPFLCVIFFSFLNKLLDSLDKVISKLSDINSTLNHINSTLYSLNSSIRNRSYQGDLQYSTIPNPIVTNTMPQQGKKDKE